MVFSLVSLSKHTKKLLLLKFCDIPAGIEVSFHTHKHKKMYLDTYTKLMEKNKDLLRG